MKDLNVQRPHGEILFEHETHTEEAEPRHGERKERDRETEIEIEWGGRRRGGGRARVVGLKSPLLLAFLVV